MGQAAPTIAQNRLTPLESVEAPGLLQAMNRVQAGCPGMPCPPFDESASWSGG